MTRVVVITGSNGGIGSATVQAFRDEGWYVVGLDLAVDAVADVDRHVSVDLTSDDAIQAAFAKLADIERWDALVNNAGASFKTTLLDTAAASWDEILALNLRAAFAMTKYAIPRMRDHGGAIVNVSSVHAVATTSGVAAYAASKGGLVALTRAAAIELAPHGIRVNAVIPGAVDTTMFRGNHESDDAEFIADRTPLGRIGQPNEIAQVILFLADGTRSSFVTGSSVVADGGALARLSTE
jgi:NAD(P)-dependent dehydrogenase (short-subunit alcohol dehydrogenase family)